MGPLRPSRHLSRGQRVLALLGFTLILSACESAAVGTMCVGRAPTCGAQKRAICALNTTQQRAWGCAPTIAGPDQACGGLGHGGRDAAATPCQRGYSCKRQDAYWWFCKPQRYVNQKVVPATRPSPPKTAAAALALPKANRSKPPIGAVAKRRNTSYVKPASPATSGRSKPRPATPVKPTIVAPAAAAKPLNISKVAPGVVYRRYRAMLSGKVLVRDVASLSYDGAAYQYGPQAYDMASCEEACRATAGCNAWAVCPPDWRSPPVAHAGCGTGCLEYGKRHRIWKSDDKDLQTRYCGMMACSETMVNITWPAEFIGPFNGFGTGSCAWTCADRKLCKPGNAPGCMFPTCETEGAQRRTDRWSLGTCTLLQVTRPQQPTLVRGPAGFGWMSGTIQVPAQCTKLSARACETCHKYSKGSATAMGRCLACLRSKNVTGAQELTFQDYMQMACRPKGSKKPYQPQSMDSSLRLSEFQCTGGYGKGAASLAGAAAGEECEAQQLSFNDAP